MKKWNKQRWSRFVDKHGFYIVLLLCLSIIGATAYLTSENRWFSRGGPIEENPVLGEESEGIPEPTPAIADPIGIEVTERIDLHPMQTPIPGPADTPASAPAGKDGQPAQAASFAPGQDSHTALPISGGQQAGMLMMPVTGNIIKGYAMEELVYSKTLKEWTTHSGIDIEGPLGAEVKAALDGIVTAVEKDALMGIIIVVDHGEGLTTVYANLSTKELVQAGQKVEKGQVISGIGRTAALEIADPPHLHFEVRLHGEVQDPMPYLSR